MCDNFSPQLDFVECLEKDLYFPINSKSYYDILRYFETRQEEDNTYYNGYEIQTTFDFVWEKYENYKNKKSD